MIEFLRYRLIGICGGVGSGKTSLVSALLGQLNTKKGHLEINGSLAYVPQQAWIFHGTVRENIVFGSPWDEEKYKKGKKGLSFFVEAYKTRYKR